jgi:hypothetical protein
MLIPVKNYVDVFQQVIGIPMGSSCNRLLADLYLAWLEYNFMRGLMKENFSKLDH